MKESRWEKRKKLKEEKLKEKTPRDIQEFWLIYSREIKKLRAIEFITPIILAIFLFSVSIGWIPIPTISEETPKPNVFVYTGSNHTSRIDTPWEEWEIKIGNNGTDIAKGIILRVTFPPNISYIDYNNSDFDKKYDVDLSDIDLGSRKVMIYYPLLGVDEIIHPFIRGVFYDDEIPKESRAVANPEVIINVEGQGVIFHSQ